MNMLLNFGEVRSRIEFLSAVVYFAFSTYLFFLLFLKKSLPLKEKNLLRALSYGFLVISFISIIREFVQSLHPEYGYFPSDLSTVLFMMLLIMPVQYYCSERVESVEYRLKHYFLNLFILTASYTIVELISIKYINLYGAISDIFLYFTLSVFVIYSGYLLIKFFIKISNLLKEEGLSVSIHKNDIFIFGFFTIFSIMLILFVLFNVRFMYIDLVIIIFSIINTLLFFKIALPYNAGSFFIDPSDSDNLIHIKEERHKINRQLSDNIKADELYGRLLKYFDKEKPYLKPDLKINEVALYLYSNKTYLSRIINDKNSQNFNQFVNYYRIEEVKNLFNLNDKLNIQELCYLSGFGSMATFSIAFRFQLGHTPADWCKEQKLRVHNE